MRWFTAYLMGNNAEVMHHGLNYKRFSKSNSLNYWIELTFDRVVLTIIGHALVRCTTSYLAGNNVRIMSGGLNENRFSKSSSLNYRIELTIDRAVLAIIGRIFMRCFIEYPRGNNMGIMSGDLNP